MSLGVSSELPESMTLMCGDQVIGVAEYDDGELEGTLLEGFECAGSVTIAEDGALFVEINAAEDAFKITVTADPTDPVVASKVELND